MTQIEIDQLVADIQAILETLIKGAKEDIKVYAAAIVDAYQKVAQEQSDKRDELLSELNGQILLLGEVQRLRAVNAQWDIIGKVLDAAIKIAIAFLVAI